MEPEMRRWIKTKVLPSRPAYRHTNIHFLNFSIKTFSDNKCYRYERFYSVYRLCIRCICEDDVWGVAWASMGERQMAKEAVLHEEQIFKYVLCLQV